MGFETEIVQSGIEGIKYMTRGVFFLITALKKARAQAHVRKISLTSNVLPSYLTVKLSVSPLGTALVLLSLTQLSKKATVTFGVFLNFPVN